MSALPLAYRNQLILSGKVVSCRQRGPYPQNVHPLLFALSAGDAHFLLDALHPSFALLAHFNLATCGARKAQRRVLLCPAEIGAGS
ncbi:hypothetical protein HYQ46_005890 [Verticillium longisporum]|nr:hypothetical protein HYQ46_005890 [Verticillium longisporum]